MLNFRSVSIRGIFNFSRARVLWQDGVIRVFNADGFVMQAMAEEPKRRPGHIKVWDSKTTDGSIALKGKCMTCGGRKWLRTYRASSDKLWESVS